MRSLVVVPANLPIGTEEPLRWPCITAHMGRLRMPGGRSVRTLHGYLLAWRLIEHPDCAGEYCFGKFVSGAACCHDSIGTDRLFWVDAEHHYHAVDIAIAVRAPDGRLEQLLLRGGPSVAAEVQRPFLGADDDADFPVVISASGSELEIRYELAPAPSSAVTQLRGRLEFSPAWRTHEQREVDPFDAVRARLADHYPETFDTEDDCERYEPLPHELCGDCGLVRENGWCAVCSWP